MSFPWKFLRLNCPLGIVDRFGSKPSFFARVTVQWGFTLTGHQGRQHRPAESRRTPSRGTSCARPRLGVCLLEGSRQIYLRAATRHGEEHGAAIPTVAAQEINRFAIGEILHRHADLGGLDDA